MIMIIMIIIMNHDNNNDNSTNTTNDSSSTPRSEAAQSQPREGSAPGDGARSMTWRLFMPSRSKMWIFCWRSTTMRLWFIFTPWILVLNCSWQMLHLSFV